MTYSDALRHFGTQQVLAAALGISQPTVSAWKGVIPPRYQFQLEVITQGELQADDALRRPGRRSMPRHGVAR
jgi:hypothetical protein